MIKSWQNDRRDGKRFGSSLQEVVTCEIYRIVFIIKGLGFWVIFYGTTCKNNWLEIKIREFNFKESIQFLWTLARTEVLLRWLKYYGRWVEYTRQTMYALDRE